MLPALIVAALTAWYLGVRIGIAVGAATAIALLLATFIPGMSITVYALVLAWCAALYFFGPKISKASGSSGASGMLGGLGGAYGTASSWAKKLWAKQK